MRPQFTKFHGLGNDYLVIEAEQLTGIDDLGEFARRICNRHYGAGGDGIAIIARSKTDEADFSCRIFNPDGSEAGLSGNGTRCAVAYLYYQQLWTKEDLRLSTRTGLKRYFLRGEPSPGKFLFESELGQPKFDSHSIPMSITPPLERVINYPLLVNGETFPVTALQMGNPNCCIFVDDFDALDAERDVHCRSKDRDLLVLDDRAHLDDMGAVDVADSLARLLNGHPRRLGEAGGRLPDDPDDLGDLCHAYLLRVGKTRSYTFRPAHV